MSSQALDLIRTMSELIFSRKALGVYVVPSSEIRKHLNGMRSYEALLEKAIGLPVFKKDWSSYEVPLLNEDACLKIWFSERDYSIEGINVVLMSLRDCSRELLAQMIRSNMWIKEVA